MADSPFTETGFDPTSCFTPRGRWVLVTYERARGDITSQKQHLYRIVTLGSGVAHDYSPGDPRRLEVGDLVVVSPYATLQVGNRYAFTQADNGILAKWDETYDEPTVLYSSLFGEPVDWYTSPGISYHSDAIVISVMGVDPAITDIAPGDHVIVPKRYAYPVGKKANTRFIFRVEDVVASCPASLLTT